MVEAPSHPAQTCHTAHTRRLGGGSVENGKWKMENDISTYVGYQG